MSCEASWPCSKMSGEPSSNQEWTARGSRQSTALVVKLRDSRCIRPDMRDAVSSTADCSHHKPDESASERVCLLPQYSHLLLTLSRLDIVFCHTFGRCCPLWSWNTANRYAFAVDQLARLELKAHRRHARSSLPFSLHSDAGSCRR